jgi:hypothetical protein
MIDSGYCELLEDERRNVLRFANEALDELGVGPVGQRD